MNSVGLVLLSTFLLYLLKKLLDFRAAVRSIGYVANSDTVCVAYHRSAETTPALARPSRALASWGFSSGNPYAVFLGEDCDLGARSTSTSRNAA